MSDQLIERDKLLKYLTQKNAEKELECEWLRNIIIRLLDEIEDSRLQALLIRQVNEELILLIQTHIEPEFNLKDLTQFPN
ncbi:MULTISPECIES: hypothetical protein [Acinetobacter]|nr:MULTISPECIES: hypothetical protein [Acinetobacter]MBJ9423856.1 hypothetical protein [Acinetobacter seifertii]MBO8215185.1 hypothetical protein [Acinetobacter nosocomialis]MCE7531262.1 hypothetical protein [Acinetobacter nosocomialis]MCG8284478.1 hypothetical protein [Acinetobacter seifertii]MCU4551048.1 hypothetical protein [Acinetobacter nosocomialis]